LQNTNQVSELLEKFERFQKSLKSEVESGKSIEQIAEYNGLDLTTTWALVLQDKSDIVISYFISQKCYHVVTVLKLTAWAVT